jgi:hypothetical protein
VGHREDDTREALTEARLFLPRATERERERERERRLASALASTWPIEMSFQDTSDRADFNSEGSAPQSCARRGATNDRLQNNRKIDAERDSDA